jgi:alkylated DNA nucleotide flippase Atl1
MAFPVKSPDGRAQWEMVYDVIKVLDQGVVITFDELNTLTGLDLKAERSPLYKAMQKLEEQDKRTIASVPGVGYRVVEAKEHELLGRRHHRSSIRQLKKAKSKFASADRSRLSPDDRERFDRLEMTVSRMEQVTRRLERRKREVQEVIQQQRDER